MKPLLILALLVMSSDGPLHGQDALSAAKDLYASAAYEDALSALARVDAAAPELAREVDEYRAFCLFALGRTREAESVTESIIRRQPLGTFDAADTSPRLERLFTDVRKRLLPSLVRDRFRTARAEIDRKNFGTAEAPLAEARLLIAESERLGVNDEGMADLRVLVDGFLQLIRSAAESRPTTRAEPLSAGSVSAPSARRAEHAAASGAVPPYSIADLRVSPPVTIEQAVPGMPPALRSIARSMKKTGMFDILIDESGHVVETTIRQSLHSAYDSTVVRSATRWRYQPATMDGVPVRYVKTIVLVP